MTATDTSHDTDDDMRRAMLYVKDFESVREYNLSNHIIFILGAPSAAVTRAAGLRNFLSPLRASSIRPEELKTVVFCVSRRFIEREWYTVASFPKVFVYEVRHIKVLSFLFLSSLS